MRLVKKVQGIGEELGSLDEVVTPNIENRFVIAYKQNVITVYRQVGAMRSMNELFRVEDDEVQRGSVGFGT